MDSKWFVMLCGGSNIPVPLMDGDNDDNVALFDTEHAADLAGASNPLGQHRGYQTFEWFGD